MLNIFVAGHTGMVGSAICRKLVQNPKLLLLTAPRSELNLTSQTEVAEFFRSQRIDQVYLAAAKVGGIHANNAYPADFIYQNLMIEANIINSSFSAGIKKLLFLGSSCIYPKFAKQPMREEALLSGSLEQTNEPYAIAKIAGVKLCESFNRQYGQSHGLDYRSVMPTNLYGPGDNYHAENSHVIPGLLRRFHEAKMCGANAVTVWGTGAPRREFLYVDDMADACLHVMNLEKSLYEQNTSPMRSHINVGYGEDVSIAELATLVADTVGYTGRIEYDETKLDGSPRKLMDSTRLNKLGWKAAIGLEKGLKMTYEDFLKKDKWQ